MSYLEELLPKFRKGAKIRQEYRGKNYFIQFKDGLILDSYGSPYKFTAIDLLEDKWEFYQEPIDWEYIRKNKCLCRFSDDDNDFVIGTLSSCNEVESLFYCETYRGPFVCCRPVRRDEVTFYEDREDGNN